MTIPRVISVNVGVIREVHWRGRPVTTGIWKYPVEGRVAVRGVNLDGDDQADRTVHRGQDKAALVGERWRVGSTLLEIAQPRLPCFKLGIRVGNPHFPKRFKAVSRMGAYLRIIEPGDVGAGDTVRVTHRPAYGVTLREMTE